MGDMHNLQLIVSQTPRVTKINIIPFHGPANGSQVISVTLQERSQANRKRVREVAEIKQGEMDDNKRREAGKKTPLKKIDLFG